MRIDIDRYLQDKDFSSDNPYLFEVMNTVDRVNELTERLEGLTGTDRLYVESQLQTNYRKLGANLTNAIKWEKEKEEFTYKSWLITFETPRGRGFGARGPYTWIRTKVEVWAETVNDLDKIPRDNWVEDKLLKMIALDDDWSWILEMNLKFAVEEESITEDEPYDYLLVTVKRLENYEIEDQWEIPY